MQNLWRALQEGSPQSDDMRTLDSRLLLGHYGWPHPDDPQLLQRWSRALAQAIHQHRRHPSLLNSLERALQRELDEGSADPLRLAAAFLPAPLAQQYLQRAAEQAFDRGAFSDYLGYHGLLAEVGHTQLDAEPSGKQRQELAWAWLHSNPAQSWWPQIPPPGPATPLREHHLTAWVPHHADAGAVRWHLHNHRLMGVDPLNRTLWQRSLDRRARVWTGSGAALVSHGDTLQRIDEQGHASDLVMPTDIAILGIYGGFIWLQGREYMYRLAIDAAPDTYQRFRLPVATIGPPIVRGKRSLWLSDHEYLLVDGDTLIARYLHGQDIDQEWRLEQGSLPSLGKVITMAGPEGERYLVQPFPDSSQALLKPGHLNRAKRFTQALAAWEQLPDEHRLAASDELARALVALGPESSWTLDAAWQWITDPRWRLRILWRYATPQAVTTKDWHTLDQLPHGADMADLLEQVGDDETVLLPVTPPHHPLYPARAWDTVISNHGLQHSLHAPQPGHLDAPQLAQHLKTERSPVEAPRRVSKPDSITQLQRQRDAQGNTQRLLNGQLLQLESSRSTTTLALHRTSQEESPLLWRHRWQAPGYLPGRSLDIDGDWIVVAEGQARLHVVHRWSGARVRAARVPNGLAMPSQARYVRNGTLAITHPISVNTQITLVDANDATQTFTLPQAAVWHIAVEDQVWVAFASGEVITYPDQAHFTWPGELPERRPQVLPEGLWADGFLWPWRETTLQPQE